MSSIIDVQAILQNWTPGYVPPVSWEELGRVAYRQRLRPQASWPKPMREAREACVAADAECSAYLVSQGYGGEL